MPENPLENLRDIHMPLKTWGWPAPGWMMLMVISFILVMWASLSLWRRFKHQRARRKALQLLRHYEKQTENFPAAHISELLRQVSLAYFPRQSVAGLCGEAWIDFLTLHSKNPANRQWFQKCLLELPYDQSRFVQPEQDRFKGESLTDRKLFFAAAASFIKQAGKQ